MTNGADQNPSQTVTKFLAGGVASVTAAFGALGTLTGGLERAVRNYPKLSVVLLIGTAFCVGLGVIAPAVSRKIPDWVLAIGVAGLLLIGSWLGVLMVDGASTKERPRVTASLAASTERLTIKGLVEASGLKSDEHMLIRVEGRTTKGELAFFHSGQPRNARDRGGGADTEPDAVDYFQLIYAARVGPDNEGKVKAPIETVAETDLYERIVVSAQLQGAVDEVRVDATRVQRCNATTPYLGLCVAAGTGLLGGSSETR